MLRYATIRRASRCPNNRRSRPQQLILCRAACEQRRLLLFQFKLNLVHCPAAIGGVSSRLKMRETRRRTSTGIIKKSLAAPNFSLAVGHHLGSAIAIRPVPLRLRERPVCRRRPAHKASDITLRKWRRVRHRYMPVCTHLATGPVAGINGDAPAHCEATQA